MSRANAKKKNSKTPNPTVARGGILDVNGVSELLKIGSQKVYDLVRTNKIPYKRIGERRLVFSESDVLHWFDNLPYGIPDHSTLIGDLDVAEEAQKAAEVVEPVIDAAEEQPLRTTEMNRTLSNALKANGHTKRTSGDQEAKVRLYLERDQIELLVALIDLVDKDDVPTALTKDEVEGLVETSYTLEHALVGHKRHQRRLR